MSRNSRRLAIALSVPYDQMSFRHQLHQIGIAALLKYGGDKSVEALICQLARENIATLVGWFDLDSIQHRPGQGEFVADPLVKTIGFQARLLIIRKHVVERIGDRQLR